MRSIGSVYVTVYADSKRFTKDAMKAAEEAGDESGRKYSKHFNKAFSDIESSPEFKRMSDQIVKDWQVIAEKNGTSLRHGVADARLPEALEPQLREMAKRFDLTTKEVAKRIAANLEGSFREVEAEIEAAAKRYEKAWDDAFKEDRARNRQRALDEEKLQQDILRAWDRAHAQQKALNLERLRREKNYLRDIVAAWEAAHRQQREMSEETTRRYEADHNRIRRSFARMFDALDGGTTKLRNRLRKAGTGGFFDTLTNVFAGLIGAAQGLGSVVGKPVELAFKAIGKAADFAGDQITQVGEDMISIGMKGGGSVKGIGQLVSSLGEMAPALGAAAGGAVALIAGLVLLESLVGAVVALISALAGMMVILGSAISYALGYLIVFAPLVVALGAAFGVLAISLSGAFSAMGKFNKVLNDKSAKERAKDLKAYNAELKELAPGTRGFVRAMEPLLRAFQTLQDRIAGRFFGAFSDSLAILTKPGGVIPLMATGLEQVATALGEGVKWILQMMGSQPFLTAWSNLWKAMGPIVLNMTKAVGGFVEGIVGFLGAIAPFTQQLSGWFSNIMIKFGEWATSTEGQNTIKTFMTDAAGAAKAVYDAVISVITALGTLFGPEGAQKDGQGLLDKIKELAGNFKTWIDETAKDGRLKGWLDDAKTVAGNLWSTIKTLGETFGALNTDKNKAFLNNVITIANIAITVVNLLITAIETLWEWVTKPFSLAGSWLGSIGTAIGNLPGDVLKGLQFGAAGMITNGPTIAGEAGPEAIIPLTRPLSMIDPSVRGMAAMIRGQATTAQIATGSSKTVNATINVVSQAADPAAVAAQVMNRAVVLTR